MKREGRGLRWLAWYTGMFLIGAGALVLALLISRRTLVWSVDGVRQYYPSLGYTGEVLRGLLRGERPPMMKFTLGQGMDVLTTCAYYGYTDVISVLTAFFSGNGVEIGYGLTSLVRLYLAGAAAGAYMRRIGLRRDWAVACSAMVYAFSGFSMHLVGMHPFFLNGPLFLPLMLIGVERALDERKWLCFTVVTALMLAANFYFAYMTTAVTIVYIIVRLIARLPGQGVAESAKDGFTLLGSYLLGALLSAVVFLPVVMVFLSNSRLNQAAGYYDSLLRYQTSYYKNLALCFFAPWKEPGYYTMLNFAPLALIGLLALCFTRGARARQVRIALYLCAIGVCVPLVGKVMNGMSYISNRWSYALAFFVAVGCAVGLSQIGHMKPWQRRIIAALTLAYGALLGVCQLRARAYRQLPGPALILAMAVLLLVYDGIRPSQSRRRAVRRLATCALVAGCVGYMLIGFLPMGYGFLKEEMPAGFYTEIASAAAGRYIEDDGVYRVSQGRYDDAQSLMLDYMGTSSYWSLVDPYAPIYYQDLMLPTQTSTCHVYGLGGGAAMNAVAGVKYITQLEGEDWVIPYGFERSGSVALPNGKTADVYENAWALPLGYAYDSALSTADYEALPVEAKLRALTAFAICDAGGLPRGTADAGATELEYAVGDTHDVTLGDGHIDARDGGTVELRFDAPEDCETYLIIEGIEVDVDADPSSERGGLRVETAQGSDEGNIMNLRNNFYFPKKGLACCLGSAPIQGCRLVFELDRRYVYDAIRVVSLPLEGYRTAVSARRNEAMTDIRLSNDRIDGRIEVTGDRVLQVAVPYSRGWRAWVDGEEQPVFLCGGMYMGIALKAGAHEIAMRYETPGLRVGAIISAAALALTAVLWIVTTVLRRRGRRGA